MPCFCDPPTHQHRLGAGGRQHRDHHKQNSRHLCAYQLQPRPDHCPPQPGGGESGQVSRRNLELSGGLRMTDADESFRSATKFLFLFGLILQFAVMHCLE